MAAGSASGIPLELIGLVTPLPADGGDVPGEIVEHQAHAIGHAAVLFADRGVLLAGDMLSDVLIPLLDPRRPDQVGAYETALDRLGEAARSVDVLVPGHGAVHATRQRVRQKRAPARSPERGMSGWGWCRVSRGRRPRFEASTGRQPGERLLACVRSDAGCRRGVMP
jgi:glyoxylase-like metal-dependent hydrolase (beta-lactamase superfamily II)